ncbi:MAG: BON domain-containing protein [Acidobacteria bacterium]|nr:BON domain-containing protein [Acidobacteriota bacterium]
MRTHIKAFVFTAVLALVALPAAQATNHTKRALTPLENQVRHELVMLPYLGVFDNVSYRVEGSTVTLAGQVYRPSMKKSADRAVARIEGVETVVNEIEVLPTSPHDDRIRRGLLRALYGHPVLDRYSLGGQPAIRIIVNNGDVTLEGVVNRELEKNVANLQANSVPGVFSVTNNLRVEVPKKG